MLVKSNQDSTLTEQGLSLDSSHWVQELEIFQSLNINKPTYVDAYTKEIHKDDKSNLDILSYTTSNEKLAIQKISIYYFKSLDDIKRITALVNNTNTLYKSAKSLQMEFIKRKDLTVLKTYSITGSQKMTMRDTLPVSIFGKVLY